MAAQPPAIVVMEACGSAHYWGREMLRLRACLCEYGQVVPQGTHQIKLIEEILDAPNSDLSESVLAGSRKRITYGGNGSCK